MTHRRAVAAPIPALLVPSLGLAQIVSWGTLIYAFALLQVPMAGNLRTSTTAIMGAFSVALAFQGLGAPVVGRLIARCGGRAVLAGGAVLSAAVYASMALVTQAVHFWLLAPFLGAAQAATMYEAAFSTLTQHSGDRARATISRVTLFGGLASSVFWPATDFLLAHMGWRDLCLIFAALHLTLCLPLVLWQVPPGTGDDDGLPAPDEADSDEATTGAVRDRRTERSAAVYLAAAFACHALVASAFGVHAIGLIGTAGIGAAEAVRIAALFGPMQLVGRILETVMGRRVDPRWSGLVALLLVPVSIACLWLLPAVAGAIAFVCLFGMSNGVAPIARGAVPLLFYPRAAYPAVTGLIAAPSLLSRAAAPVLFAGLLTGTGAAAGLVMLGAGLAATTAYLPLFGLQSRATTVAERRVG